MTRDLFHSSSRWWHGSRKRGQVNGGHSLKAELPASCSVASINAPATPKPAFNVLEFTKCCAGKIVQERTNCEEKSRMLLSIRTDLT
jgi:hypothetical protein